MNPKIIATIGKNSGDYNLLKEMAEAGVDIFRINFSHATSQQLSDLKNSVEKLQKELNKKIEIMQDLCGPRIRVGVLPNDIHMKEDEVYSFSYADCSNEKNCIPIDHKEIINDVQEGHPFYLANGAIELAVEKIQSGKIYAKVEHGGVLSSRKGVNVPQTNLSAGGMTEKDEKDAELGAKEKVDYMAMSFVQNADDLKNLRKISGPEIKLIAKIERGTALPVIDEIIKESDGIMIARGDLGVETPFEELPMLQKELIQLAHWHKKPAIVATQMMLSMVEKPHPTYAEVTDVANAVFDGADALMLSDETASGKYPIECIKTMKKIIDKADGYINKENHF